MTFNEVVELFREQYERPYTDRLSKLSRDEVGEILACLEVVARYEWPPPGRCSFSAEVLAEGVPSPCILREGHKGRHELEPGHYIHDDAREPLCEDCPPKGYPTDKTRCLPCPRRAHG